MRKLFYAITLLMLPALYVFAQGDAPEIGEANMAVKQFLAFLGPFLEGFVQSNPKLAAVLMFIGSLRSVLKPLVSFVWSILNLTPKTSDNEAVKKVVESKIFGIFAYLLDYFASVKLKNPEKKA